MIFNNKDMINIANTNPQKLISEYGNPWLGAEYDLPELFGKCGSTICGICDGFEFYPEKLKKMSENELWKMIALSKIYWFNHYEEFLNNVEKDYDELYKRFFIFLHKEELKKDKEKADMLFKCQFVRGLLPSLEDLKKEIIGENKE